MRCVEAELWASEADKLLAWKQRKISGGETFAAGATSFLHVQRIVNSCERNFHNSLKEMQRLKAMPPQAEEATLPTLQPEQSTHTSDFSRNEANFPEATPPPPLNRRIRSPTPTQTPLANLPDAA